MKSPGKEQMVYLWNLLYNAGFKLKKENVTIEQYTALVDFVWDDKPFPKKWGKLIEIDSEGEDEHLYYEEYEDELSEEAEGNEQESTILEKCIQVAKNHFSGNLTILRFTSNWRCCFGTLTYVDPYTTAYMAEGKTLEEALEKTLKYHINAYDIEDEIDEEQRNLN